MPEPCGLCGSPYLSAFLNMGAQPLAEAYGKDSRKYLLRLVRCQACSLVQLADPVAQQVVFPEDHPYAVGDTGANRDHFKRLAVKVGWRLRNGDVLVDIGANDGTFLSMFDQGVVKVAVEPTGQAEKIDDSHVYKEFFTLGLAQRIRDEFGRASLITACNVLAHVPDPHEFLSGVHALLEDDGVFVTENHDLRSLVDGLQIDTVYHEHRWYWDIATMGDLLASHGLAITDVEPITRHGGSFRVTAQKVSYSDMQARAADVATKLHVMLAELHADGHEVYGVSASTRATPLMHYTGIGQYLTCVCEVEGSAKIGLTMPGTDIPIVPDSVLVSDQPPYALLFCWHIKDLVIPKLRAQGYQGRFIIPLPRPEIIL